MFQKVLPFVSITYENGSATWYKGKIYQHVKSFDYLKKVLPKLQKVKNKNIKGFEPKEFIITIHCKNRIKQIENIVSKENKLYYIWNSEAYDIGVKKIQTKGIGVKNILKLFKLKKENVLALGDNYNDVELLNEVGIKVSADKSRLQGDYYVPLKEKILPAGLVMQQIIQQTKKS